ncbi:DUF397 domain-containing protein [Streptomyces sp. bgisy100]|uniref:DUF397 domain-containing protein n=1 Tax=Streptomyces sp. bgisy100 TaxID=3413783 RepID=UPI003D707028
MAIKPSNPSRPAWTKSSHSSNDGPECVEVAATPGTVLVRDSKDQDGPRLAFTPPEWEAFVSFAGGLAARLPH